MSSFRRFVEQQNAFTIGLFPGAFKPPHKGHFETAKKMAGENMVGIILVSGDSRETVTPEKSLKIWEIYKKYLPKNVYIFTISGSPVTAIYQIVNTLNNGEYVATSAKAVAPLPETLEIADSLKNNAPPYKIKLYASEEDLARYKAFFDKEKSKIYKSKNVTAIESKDIARLASATQARQALHNKQAQEFMTFLPPISDKDKQTITKMLL